MKKQLPKLILAFLLLSAFSSFAQIVVTFPSDRAVFQRNRDKQAEVYVGGYAQEMFDRVEARFEPLVSGQGIATPAGEAWNMIDNTLEAGHYLGHMTVTQGWYKLRVRGVKKNGTVVETVLGHVGVGEVFIVAGQSNATGGDQNDNGVGAVHDQVNSVDFQNYNPGTLTSYSYEDTKLPCPVFVHLDANVKTAPFGNYAWCWGSFGDKLYEKLGVPIMIFNAGWSSTAIANWQQSINTTATTVSAYGLPFPTGQPFGHLRLALNNYAAQLGVRAILWHQGESDNLLNTTESDYQDALWAVIQASRTAGAKPNLAWLVSRASRYTVDGVSRTYANVINAQNNLVNGNVTYPHVYPGPATDDYYDLSYRGDQVHFKGPGLVSLAGFWVDQITEDFINQSEPYIAAPPAAVSAAYTSGGTRVAFTAPNVASAGYNWIATDCRVSESTAMSWTPSGTGNFKLKMTDANKNVVYSPQLFVAGSALPVTWKSFTAKTNNAGRSLLEWATSNETNSSHFEVERSLDATVFNTIKKVNAAGESKIEVNYQYEDEFLSSGTYYYRLKQVDFDGKFEYSKIESVKVNANLAARAYPNPVKEKLTIEAVEPLGRIDVIDAKGIKLYSADSQLKSLEINMSVFPNGLYTVTIDGKSFKIIK